MVVEWIGIIQVLCCFTAVGSLNLEVETSLEQSLDGSTWEPVFKCMIDQPEDDVLYDVQWFINEDVISGAESRDVAYHNMNNTSLKVGHWAGNYSLNFNVSCSITMKNATSGNITLQRRSSQFLAGIQADSSGYTVREGEGVTVHLTNSLPFTCPTSLNDSTKETKCRMTLDVWITREKTRERCRNGLAMRDLLLDSSSCSLTFGFSENGNSTIEFNLTGYVDGMINYENRISTVHFNVTSYQYDSHGVWSNISIPEIQVTILDSDYLVDGMLCTSYNDPHMTTFDGKHWENQLPGEFVMYRHRDLPFSVNVLFSSCVGGYATCNCGVAVRSNFSLYVVRTCAQISSTNTELLVVPHEKLTLNRSTDLHITKTGRLFKVTFPTGTSVNFDLSYDTAWISSVRIQASVLDLDASEGMCGSANNNWSDDFTLPQGNVTMDDQSFALSWRVPLNSNESLFSANPYPPLKNSTTREWSKLYNLCPNPSDSSDDTSMYNVSVPSTLCTEDSSIATHLSILTERTKEAGFTDNLSYDPDFNETYVPQPPDWKNGWNESSARTFCENSFSGDPGVDACQTIAGMVPDSYVESCMRDIKLSGNTTYLQDSVNTFKGACLEEVTHDEVYYINASTDGRFLVDVISSLLCPRDCSGNGNCTNVSCVCHAGFIGMDCSIEKSTPPEVFLLPYEGLCDTSSSGSCQQIHIIGFFHSEVVFVKLTCFVIHTNGSVVNATVTSIQATYHHLNLISLDIPTNINNSKTATAQGCNISLSYNGVTYDDVQILLMYDKDRYDCNRESLQCTAKEDGKLEPIDSDKLVLIAILGAVSFVLLLITSFVVVQKCKSHFPCAAKSSMIPSPPPRQHALLTHNKTKKLKIPHPLDSIITSHPPIKHDVQNRRNRKPSFSFGFVPNGVGPQHPPTSHFQGDQKPHRLPPLEISPFGHSISSAPPRRQELHSKKRRSHKKSLLEE
uniref:von Willebrand factor D and EGF domain-containing protein-like n=1 Tax=Crassostrea virginica TaxID=6565 RepID=A0A8B8B4C6_CRAVI|nr:von Willebrand factor D and EGF domain-containing protein-like [Crassostrea virginica]